MNKKIKILLGGMLFSLSLQAQTVEEIQQSDEYLWGTGNAPTLRQADNEALASLISQISTNVSSRYEQVLEGGTENGEVTEKDKFKSIINTYSHSTLTNTQRIVIQNEPDAAVMRYIKKSEIQRIFNGRKVKLLDFAQEAMRLEKKAQVADALRYYYWSLTLLQSYPDGNYLTMKDDKGQEQLLVSWIPKQMKNIFTNINLSVEGEQVDGNLKTVTLKVLYKGKPARNYDYSYFDGRDWSNIFSAKDGLGVVELPAIASVDGLSVKTEYMFEGEANIDSELSEVMGSVTPIAMRDAYLKLSAAREEPVAQPGQTTLMASSIQAKETNSGMKFLSTETAAPYEQTMAKVEKAIRTHNFDGIESLCTPEGYDMFQRLIKYGNCKILRQPNLKYLSYNGEITCRSIPMSFSFQGNRRTFVEDVVFQMTPEGKITSLSFGLNKPAVDDIMNQTAWGDTARQVLITFLESYKTAYALKRLEYIRSIFSDDALIITGSVVKASGQMERQPIDGKVVKYTRQTKGEYMKKLEHIFAGSEFINLRFADNQVRKSGVGGEIYGIQIKQDYFSSSYGDTGYLFLMVDLNHPKEPVIHVRTWQPEKDPNFGLIDLSYF